MPFLLVESIGAERLVLVPRIIKVLDNSTLPIFTTIVKGEDVVHSGYTSQD